MKKRGIIISNLDLNGVNMNVLEQKMVNLGVKEYSIVSGNSDYVEFIYKNGDKITVMDKDSLLYYLPKNADRSQKKLIETLDENYSELKGIAKSLNCTINSSDK